MKNWLIKFPRLNQLYERIGPSKANNVLGSYIEDGNYEFLVQEHAKQLEKVLARLNSVAWEHLIQKVLPYGCIKKKHRGWQQFFDHLNESRGYVLLEGLGYSEISFIPTKKNTKTTEFFGVRKSPASRAILEVKTINRSDYDLKRNDPTFWEGKSGRAGDIENLSAFLDKLSHKSDAVSAFLWEQLDKSAQEVLTNDTSESSSTKQKESILVRHLNEVIKGDCVYEKVRFHGVALRELTRGFMKEKPKGKDLVFLNRWLLEDAYPQELSKLPDAVVNICPDMPIPPSLKQKLEKTIATARSQLLQHQEPVDKRILLIIINRDFGCLSLPLKKIEASLWQHDLEIVCQVGDR